MLFLPKLSDLPTSHTQTSAANKLMVSAHNIKQALIPICMLLMLSALHCADAAVKNSKPSAVVGTTQSVVVNTPVTLDGQLSNDSDGNIKKWQWTQTQGTKVKLTNANKAVASFTSPKLKSGSKSTTLVFKLTVTDNKNASAFATLAVTVSAEPICVLPKVLENSVCVTPPPICVPPQTLVNGVCLEHKVVCSTGQVFLNGICFNPQPVCQAPQILINGVCVTPQTVCALPLVLQNKQCVTAPASGTFNDTGIVLCSDGAHNVDGCGNSQFPQQDAEFGRDVTHYNDYDGRAGFSFSKISAEGATLPLTAKQWACIKDNVTGLMWENKTLDGGLHDKYRTFSYYSPSFNPNNEYATATDATGFVAAVNNQAWCGVSNWRIPTAEELQSIVSLNFLLPGPSIDESFFANTRNIGTWTSSPLPRTPDSALILYMDDGRIFDSVRNPTTETSARLVSGNPVAHAYTLSADGQEVIDSSAKLVWRRCVEGKSWNGTACIGNPLGFMFQEALQRALDAKIASGQKWRLPNIKELTGLMDTTNPVVALNETLFPNSPNDQYWSGSSFSTDGFFAWVAHFYYGWVYYTYTEDTGVVRLVRDQE